MSEIIAVIIVYIIGTFIKNIINDGKKAPPVRKGHPTANNKQYKPAYEPSAKEKVIMQFGEDIIPINNDNKKALDKEDNRNLRNKINVRKESYVLPDNEDDLFLSLLNEDDIYNGIILSEILAPPKARRK